MTSYQEFGGVVVFKDIKEDNSSDTVYVRNSETGEMGWVKKTTIVAEAVQMISFKIVNNDLITSINNIGAVTFKIDTNGNLIQTI